jgi:hypothetical protein
MNLTPKRKVARWNRAGGTTFLGAFSFELFELLSAFIMHPTTVGFP